MRMMPEWARILAPLFLVGQGLVVYLTAGMEHAPAPPRLAQFPSMLDGWTELHEDPVDPDTVNTLRADRLLSRTYGSGAGQEAGLFVAWFRSQRAGLSQPHSPKVCLPASGWVPVSTGELSIATAAGVLPLNRYVIANRDERAVVLYWYETSRGAVAGEWASKLMLLVGAVRDRRTDTALVRIVVESQPGKDESATAIATNFTQAAYPMLRDILPR